MPWNPKAYPSDWKERRARILKRAGFRCETCGIAHLAVGYRDAEGKFRALCGNGPCDAAGQGKTWPSLQQITYGEAQEFVEQINDHGTGKRLTDADGNHWFVVRLTIAHLDRTGPPGPDDGPLDCPDDRLKALCERCHLTLDARRHAAKRERTRIDRRAVASLFPQEYANVNS